MLHAKAHAVIHRCQTVTVLVQSHTVLHAHAVFVRRRSPSAQVALVISRRGARWRLDGLHLGGLLVKNAIAGPVQLRSITGRRIGLSRSGWRRWSFSQFGHQTHILLVNLSLGIFAGHAGYSGSWTLVAAILGQMTGTAT